MRWLALLVGLATVGALMAHRQLSSKPAAAPADSKDGAKKGGAKTDGATKGGGEKPPLAVATLVAKAEPHASVVTASGQLAPVEEVQVVSELSRRLVKIHAEEGSSVKAGDVLYEVDGSDLAARHASLRAQRDLAARTLARREKIEDSLAVSPHELDVARTNLATLQADLREVSAQLAKTRIRAPFSGVLGTRNVSEGAWLTPQVVITTLYDTSRFKIDFTLAERYAADLTLGASFRFTVAGKTGEGQIAVIEPTVDSRSRSLRVRGVVDAQEGLVAGSFAAVELPLEKREALFVPSIAVQAAPDGHTVWVATDGKAELRPVTIGERTVERIEIVSGLNAGEQVIVSNLLRLAPGMPVVVQPSP
ncbi:MAG: efflux RND transporter periplasmic adaptor subunit [Polyangiaceae bacterium]